MAPVRRSLCRCLCFCAEGGHLLKAFWFSKMPSFMHNLKRQSLFRRDKVPAQNTLRTFRLFLYKPKESFGGSKGRFFKNAPLAGSGTASRKKETRPLRQVPFQKCASGRMRAEGRKRGQTVTKGNLSFKNQNTPIFFSIFFQKV